MVIYTFATVAFYLLGAGVLNKLGLIPESSKMIENLSKMYTEILGSAGLYLFFFGAIAVLYSTIFAATAGLSRQFADLVGLAGVYKGADYKQRLKWQRIIVVVFNTVSVLLWITTIVITVGMTWYALKQLPMFK